MRRIRDRVAGLDVHRDSVVACVELFDGTSVQVDKATFSTTAKGVRDLGEWLAESEVELVVMEATGVYWRPVYYGLEDRFEEPLHQLAAGGVGHPLAGRLDAPLAHHQGQLDPQELVEHEPPACGLRLAHRLRSVDARERRRAGDEVVLVEEPAGQRLDELAGPLQRLPQPAADVLRVEAGIV